MNSPSKGKSTLGVGVGGVGNGINSNLNKTSSSIYHKSSSNGHLLSDPPLTHSEIKKFFFPKKHKRNNGSSKDAIYEMYGGEKSRYRPRILLPNGTLRDLRKIKDLSYPQFENFQHVIEHHLFDSFIVDVFWLTYIKLYGMKLTVTPRNKTGTETLFSQEYCNGELYSDLGRKVKKLIIRLGENTVKMKYVLKKIGLNKLCVKEKNSNKKVKKEKRKKYSVGKLLSSLNENDSNNNDEKNSDDEEEEENRFFRVNEKNPNPIDFCLLIGQLTYRIFRMCFPQKFFSFSWRKGVYLYIRKWIIGNFSDYLFPKELKTLDNYSFWKIYTGFKTLGPTSNKKLGIVDIASKGLTIKKFINNSKRSVQNRKMEKQWKNLIKDNKKDRVQDLTNKLNKLDDGYSFKKTKSLESTKGSGKSKFFQFASRQKNKIRVIGKLRNAGKKKFERTQKKKVSLTKTQKSVKFNLMEETGGSRNRTKKISGNNKTENKYKKSFRRNTIAVTEKPIKRKFRSGGKIYIEQPILISTNRARKSCVADCTKKTFTSPLVGTYFHKNGINNFFMMFKGKKKSFNNTLKSTTKD